MEREELLQPVAPTGLLEDPFTAADFMCRCLIGHQGPTPEPVGRELLLNVLWHLHQDLG